MATLKSTLIAACVAIVGMHSGAHSVGAQDLLRTTSVTDDNEFFNFWLPIPKRPDNNYTQGARVSTDIQRVPGAGRRLVCGQRRACGVRLEFGQEMYTPTKDSPTPLPGERPYAGWLYGRLAVRTADVRQLRSFGMTLGVTGPPSLGESVQRGFHSLFGFRRPLGWKYQLATEPAFALIAEHTWRFAPGYASSFIDFLPSVGATAGTLRTAIGGGGRLRVGTGIVHPWLAADSIRRFAIHGFVATHVEGVARDLFLDGNTFRNSITVDSEPIRGQWERGVHIDLGLLGIEYSATSESRPYRTGPASHTYSTLTAIWALR